MAIFPEAPVRPLSDHVTVPWPLLRNAGEIAGFLNAAAAFVSGGARIRADGTSASGPAALYMRANEHGWRLAFFHPIYRRSQPVHVAAAWAASAMEHAGDREEAVEVLGLFLAHGLHRGFIVIHRHFRRD